MGLIGQNQISIQFNNISRTHFTNFKLNIINNYQAKVVCRHGAHLVVKDELNVRHACITTKKFSHAVCGDNVICKTVEQDRDLIIELMPRKNELVRQTEHACKTVATNIDTIVIVCSIEPKPSLELIDHYIVAAEHLVTETLIVINKTDLNNAENIVASLKNKYRHLPYLIFETTKTNTLNTNKLTNQIKNKTCIFVGQSGVGKSTLINTLIPNLDIETQSISDQISQGKHTTSTTTLYDLPFGGEIIDSPGVRDFSTPKLNTQIISKGFIEINTLANECKFHDCKHINEPQCAVKLAVENGTINIERYDSYKSMIEEFL